MSFDLGIPESKDDVMLLDVQYHKPDRDHSWTDMIQIVYKVISSGKKKVLNITNPTIDVYFAQPGSESAYCREFMPIEQLQMKRFPYKDLEMCIAQEAGEKWVNYIKENTRTRNRQASKNVHKYPNVYGSDYDIAEWYKIMWMIHYNNDTPKPITRLFMDIEVNIVNLKGFPKDGERPVNVITLVDPDAKKSYALLLREDMIEDQIDEMEAHIDEFVEELEEAFGETYGELEYLIYTYDDELELLRDYFRLLHTLDKDFAMFWNMDFDIPYINDRLKVLGEDPEVYWCTPDFERHICYYKKSRFFDVVSRDSKFFVSMKTIFLDQMVVYAAMRKGQGTLRSNNLNAVGEVEVGDGKLDYGEASNLGILNVGNYRKYIMYGIKDTLLQMGIDNKTNDIESLYQRALTNCISYSKAFKQTKFLENRAYIEYYNQGLIIGNNVNIDYAVPYEDKKNTKNEDGEEEESFKGGLVADPKLNGYEGIYIYGSKSKYVYKNVVDFDFASMYPNEIATFNISRTSMIGKLIVDAGIEDVYKVYQNIENATDKGHSFMEEYLTKHFVTLGKRWFNLPGTEELITEFVKEFVIDQTDVFEGIKNTDKSVIEYQFKLVG